MRKVLMLIVSILLLIGFVGFTYVMYDEFVNASKDLSLDVVYDNEEESSIYKLADTIPISNEDGMLVDSFDFSITNNTEGLSAYRITVTGDPSLDSSLLIDNDYIMVSFQKDNGGYSQPMSLSDVGEGFYIVNNQFIDGSVTVNYGIKLWVSDKASVGLAGKVFQGVVSVDTIELENGKYLDTTKPTISLNGEEVVNVIKGDSFTDLGVSGIGDNKDTLSIKDVIVSYYNCNNECIEINDIDISKVGSYQIKYMIADKSFNYNSVYRTVNVVE